MDHNDENRDVERGESHNRQEAGKEQLREDHYRLRYHFMPPAGWMNDPNGLIFFKGEYHIFYQYHPHEAKWGPMHWGHAKSKDLITWEHLPIALAPSEYYDLGESGGYGCWSGSAVDDNGVLTLVYRQGMLTGDRLSRFNVWQQARMVSFLKKRRITPLSPDLQRREASDFEILKCGNMAACGIWS
nr:hypothetical protein [Paenibacillus sp. YPD9-1]